MFDIGTDPAKNRLYLKFEGYLRVEELKSAVEQMIRAARSLRPGFDIINDISGFKPASPQATGYIKQLQQEVMNLHAGKIVRVIGSNVLAKIQFSRTSREVGFDAYAVGTLQEAEQFLDGGHKR